MHLKAHLKNMKRAIKLQKKVAHLGVAISFSISKEVESQKVSSNRIAAVKEGKSGYGLQLDILKSFKILIKEIKEYIKPKFRKAYSNTYIGCTYYLQSKSGQFEEVTLVGILEDSFKIQFKSSEKIVEIKKRDLYDTEDKIYLLKNSYFEMKD